ncbi:MAG: hypothetical protein ACYDIA_19080, partial [Candidatus Humimicrobiaceae bacterium]
MKPEVALIYPYFRTFADIQQLFQPLGIAYLRAEIKNLGIPVIQYDCTFKKYDNVIDSIVKQNPGIVGIYTMITLSRNTFKMLTSLREKLPHSLSLPFDEISFTVPYPLPGSNLYNKIKGLNLNDDWDFENENKFVFKSQF